MKQTVVLRFECLAPRSHVEAYWQALDLRGTVKFLDETTFDYIETVEAPDSEIATQLLLHKIGMRTRGGAFIRLLNRSARELGK